MNLAPLLQLHDLTVAIRTPRGEVPVVRGVSFDLHAGRTLAVVGESGSGKTMTAMSLLGLGPPGTPLILGGEAKFNGRDLLVMPERELRALRGRQIGVVFQDPSGSLNPLMTVGEQIREAACAAGAPRTTARAKVAALLDEVGLGQVPGIAGRHPHELSGGQQQRCMIALALAGDPDLLIADEPTTALDSEVADRIIALLADLRSRRGMALLFISHDLGVVSRLAQDIVVVRNGQVVETGSTRRILANPQHEYTKALIACTPSTGGPPRARLMTLDMIRRGADPGPKRPVSPGPTVLSVRDLTVKYPGRGLLRPGHLALQGVSLDLHAGSSLGLVGASGSGKSTLGRALVGLVAAQSGDIRINERILPASGHRTAEDRRDVQYVFQDAAGALNPRRTIGQSLVEPQRIHGLASGALEPMLAEVGLPADISSRFPAELSGGQLQRVTIARALALEPRCLICDEITSALDVSSQAQVLNVLSDLRERHNLAILFISHDRALVEHFCDQVLLMNSGRLTEDRMTTSATGSVRETPKVHETA